MGSHSSLVITPEQARKIWADVVKGNEEATLAEMEAFFDAATDEACYNVCIYSHRESTDEGLVQDYVERYLREHPSARPASLTHENRLLREMLAIRVAGVTGLYTDDGELQDSSELPMIDFKRDSAEEIRRKLTERGMRKLQAQGLSPQ